MTTTWGEREEQHARVQAKILARAWSDQQFLIRLLANPEDEVRRALQEEGLDLEPGTRVEVHVETPKIYHLVIPQPPHPLPTREEIVESLRPRPPAPYGKATVPL